MVVRRKVRSSVESRSQSDKDGSDIDFNNQNELSGTTLKIWVKNSYPNDTSSLGVLVESFV